MAEEQTTHGSSVGRRYDALGGRYDVWTRFFDGTVVNALRRALLSTAGGRVLEVAIGSGKNLRYYLRLPNIGHRSRALKPRTV